MKFFTFLLICFNQDFIISCDAAMYRNYAIKTNEEKSLHSRSNSISTTVLINFNSKLGYKSVIIPSVKPSGVFNWKLNCVYDKPKHLPGLPNPEPCDMLFMWTSMMSVTGEVFVIVVNRCDSKFWMYSSFLDSDGSDNLNSNSRSSICFCCSSEWAFLSRSTCS